MNRKSIPMGVNSTYVAFAFDALYAAANVGRMNLKIMEALHF